MLSIRRISSTVIPSNAILREIRHEKRIVNRIVEEERSLNKEQKISKTYLIPLDIFQIGHPNLEYQTDVFSKTERTEIRHRR